jgi:hypothetical protein
LALAPHSIQDGKVRRADQDVGVGAVVFAQGSYESGGVGDGAANDFSNCFTAAFGKGGSAISGKTVDIEHRGSPDQQLTQHGLRLTAPSRQKDQAPRSVAFEKPRRTA